MMSTCEKIGAFSSDHELEVKYKYNFQIMNHAVNMCFYVPHSSLWTVDMEALGWRVARDVKM